MTHGSELLIGNELTNTSYEHGTSYPHQVRWADFFHLKFNMLLVIRLLCSSRGLIVFLRHLKEKNKGECLIFWNANNLGSLKMEIKEDKFQNLPKETNISK